MTNKPMLPCPFCAGKVREPVAKPIGHGEVCFAVSCNCGLSFDGGQDIESAVRTWNRRAVAAPVAMTDDHILEAMRLSITPADGGYIFDLAPNDVIAAGRSLLEVASLLDIKQSPVAVVMLEQLIEAIGVEQDRLFQDAERMTVEDCVKVIRQELYKLNGVNK